MTDKYPGFSQDLYEAWFPYPEELSEWWYKLTGSEQKVLDFILRHTLGFQKTSDTISYRQFIKGVRNCDNGCGVRSTKTLSNAIKGLINKGYITKTGERTSGKPIKYCLVYKTEEKEDKGLSKIKRGSLKSKKVRSLETKDTINNNSINNSQYIYTGKDKKITKNLPSKYSSINEITEADLQEIAEKYQVPLSFIKSKYDDMILWIEEKPNDKRIKGRNWKMTLMNWVKRDALKIRKEASGHVRPTIDARGLSKRV